MSPDTGSIKYLSTKAPRQPIWAMGTPGSLTCQLLVMEDKDAQFHLLMSTLLWLREASLNDRKISRERTVSICHIPAKGMTIQKIIVVRVLTESRKME